MHGGEGDSLKELAWVDSRWEVGSSWTGGCPGLCRHNSGKQDLVECFESHSQATQSRTGGLA